MIHDYTRKRGIVHSEILLPPNAPPDFQDRGTLWNSVEQIEKACNSQLARELEVALPIELSREEQVRIVRAYCSSQFVSRGMCADFNIHDTGSGNPHAHILLTMRPMDERGKWLPKSKKEYVLDESGERIRLPSGNFKTRKVDLVDWNSQENAEVWRKAWADLANEFLERNNRPERIDHRSYERQGIDQIPTVHIGVAASQMEKKGIATERGELNRSIKAANRLLRDIKAQIGKHYQYLSDHDSFLTAKKVYDRYNGFGEEIHSLMEIFNIQIRDYKRQIGKTKAQSTYRGLVDEYKCLSCYLKDKLGTEDIPLMSLDMDFIKNYYNWMLSVRGLAKSTAFERVNTLKWLMYLAMDEGWIHKHPFKKFVCKPEYKKRPFLSEEDLQRVISVKLSYRRQQTIRDMFVFMCFSGLAHADLKELSYRNVHTDSDGNTWLVGNRVKTKAPYVVKLLPIAVELIEKYRGG